MPPLFELLTFTLADSIIQKMWKNVQVVNPTHALYLPARHHCQFLSVAKSVFSEGRETFLNQLLTEPGSQNLFDRESESAQLAEQMTELHFSDFIPLSYLLENNEVLFVHLPPGNNRPLETMNRHILRILKRFIICALVHASSILKNIMSVRSGTHLKYTRFL